MRRTGEAKGRTADLLALEDRARLLARDGRLVQRLVAVGVKLLARRVKRHDAVAAEDLLEAALEEADALVQALEVGVVGGRDAVLGNRAQREVEDVDLADEVLGERLERKVLCGLLLARRDLLQVLKVGEGAEAGVLGVAFDCECQPSGAVEDRLSERRSERTLCSAICFLWSSSCLLRSARAWSLPFVALGSAASP